MHQKPSRILETLHLIKDAQHRGANREDEECCGQFL
jgi:hypothetical protein